MKYSEFKREVEKMGFVVVDSGFPIYIDKSANGETLLSVGKNKRFWLDPGWGGFEQLEECQKLELYALGYELAKTPLAEREEEKRYYLMLTANLSFYMDETYLNYNPIKAKYFVSNKFEKDSSTAIFTESEIALMDITGFQKVEVTE